MSVALEWVSPRILAVTGIDVNRPIDRRIKLGRLRTSARPMKEDGLFIVDPVFAANRPA